MKHLRNGVGDASVATFSLPGKSLKVCSLSLAISALSNVAFAQTEPTEEVIVTGIRASLASALEEKRSSDNLVEVIRSEDIGKLPDQNLAEVLENITGIQITRTAGVGTNVQIRGTDDNRTEINGVSTVGSGSGRTGISFEDVNASIIAAVEVTKSPEAKTIEGSVGGTVNLKTIRPLELTELLGSVRIQGEESSLSTEGIQPRISGAFGNNWETSIGDVGFVLSGSYTEQEAVSFRPRADRDALVSVEDVENPTSGEVTASTPDQWQGIQFLTQEQENDDYETVNLATTIEWAPDENTKFHVDYIRNDQERSRDQYRLQASGVSNLLNYSVPTAFETIDYGTVEGQTLPTYAAALVGTLEPRIPVDGDSSNLSDGNLRMTSETNARVTDSSIFSLGGEWSNDRFTASFEVARSESSTSTPSLNTTLNFMNPNAPYIAQVRFQDVVDDDGNVIFSADDLSQDEYYWGITDADERADIFGVGSTAETQQAVRDNYTALAFALAEADFGGAIPEAALQNSNVLNDNATPFAYDLRGGSLAFGIDADSIYAPTSAQLLDPANYALDAVQVTRSFTDNKEEAFRVDFSYDLEVSGITSVEWGYRFNESSSKFSSLTDNIGGFTYLEDAPNAADFSELLVAGPDNFGDADGRDLFIRDFLLLDPDRSFSDPDGVLAIIEDAIADHDSSPDVLSLADDLDAFFDVSEETNALYAQVNFDLFDMVRGNAGLRYVNTHVSSTAFGPANDDGVRNRRTTQGSYDQLLPRVNVVVQPMDDLIFRLGYTNDILRPDFSDLNTAFTLDTSENTAVDLGDPGLKPEEVVSWDIAAEYYFAPSAVVSLGYFHKKRTNLFGQFFEAAALIPNGDGGFVRETDPSCPGGGFYNPVVIPNVLGDPTTEGLCVDFTQPTNDSGETTQQGFEFAVQYDLSSFEDTIGFASGFGVQANYTIQEFDGGDDVDITSGRGEIVLGEVSISRGLLDFSETAYNVTAYYDKYGLSARFRYTWREAFRTLDFGGGANTSGSSTLSFPVVTEDRGQLNASISYDVTSNFNIGVEAVNLTEERITQRCVTETGPVCFVGYPDRRITFGGSYRF